jgi:macrolide transport system ATP-binding/permease protein
VSYWSRFLNVFRNDRLMHDIDEELASHIEDAVAAGRDRAEAQRALGSPLHHRERSRDVRLLGWMADLLLDVRYGCRMLWRSPGFSLLAILCLTLGMGANAAVFSWIEGILLRPYPLVVDQERLLAVTGTDRASSPGRDDVSWPDWLDLQRGSTLVDAFIAEKITGTTLNIGDRAERATGSMVSANYFDAIGVHPIFGRGFEPGEDVGRGAHPVTVISYQMWRNRFHGDPDIIGKTQVLNGLPHTIVGVAPEGFFGTFVGYAFQFWVPASMQPQFDAGVYKLEDRGARWIEGYVRLKPGVTRQQAQAELSAIAARLEAEHPDTNRGRGVRLYPLWQTPFNNAGALLPTLAVALVVVFAVLLIACANVGNLLLVRAFARHQEMTIRLSVGAGRWRLVKQLLTEGAILSVIAGTGGLVVANWLRNALALLTPPRGGVLLRLPGDLDWRVLALSGGVCITSTLLFGMVPALLTSNVDLAGALRSESGGVVGAHRRAWVRSALVVMQVSLSVVLLIGAALLIKSMQAVRNASPGFAADEVVTTWVDLFTAGYTPARARVFQDELIDRLQAMSGVTLAAFSRSTPFSYRSYSSAPIAVDGFEAPPDQQPTAEYNEVGPDFLATIGIPLVSGREFTRADDETAPPVAIVDETMAEKFWRGVDPVGRRLQVRGRWRQVVGVARAAKYRNLLETPQPFFYVPIRQDPSVTANLQIRTRQSPALVAPALVREVRALNANLVPGEVITMREQVDRTTASQRIAVTILVVFGMLALVLAAVGLYGVMAATVSQSGRELALRRALGAESADLLRLVVFKGLTLTGIGAAIGVAASFQATRLLGYLLYRVSPQDPFAFAAAFLTVAVAASAACLVPALRAMRTDPIHALRG